jgi:hypothetical protein
MLRSVQPTTPEDAPEIARLLAQTGLHPHMSEAEMLWRYWQPREDWPGPRSFVMAQDGEILAHAAVVPGTLAWEGGRARTLHLIDWAARPRAVGAGVALMKHIGRLTDMLFAIGGSAHTLRILPQLGFQPLGVATEFVRPLHPLRILGGVQGPGWRLLPRTLRSAYWSAAAPAPGAADGIARRIDPESLAALAADLPVPAAGVAIFERSEALLRYVLGCPVTALELYAWERASRASGYFLLAFAPGQARLADCWTRSEDPGDWRALVQCAVREARRNPDAAELIAWGSEPLAARALARSGFHVRGAQPISYLATQSFTLGATRVRVQMLDNDAAYSHHGRAELWA